MVLFYCDHCDYCSDRRDSLVRHLNRKNKCYDKVTLMSSTQLINSIIKLPSQPELNATEMRSQPELNATEMRLQNSEPQNSEPQKSEPKNSEPQNSEPKNSEPKNSEPQKSEPQKTEPQKTEPQKNKNLQNLTKTDNIKTIRFAETKKAITKRRLRNYHPKNETRTIDTYEDEKIEYNYLLDRLKKYLKHINCTDELSDNIKLHQLQIFHSQYYNEIRDVCDKLIIH